MVGMTVGVVVDPALVSVPDVDEMVVDEMVVDAMVVLVSVPVLVDTLVTVSVPVVDEMVVLVSVLVVDDTVVLVLVPVVEEEIVVDKMVVLVAVPVVGAAAGATDGAGADVCEPPSSSSPDPNVDLLASSSSPLPS